MSTKHFHGEMKRIREFITKAIISSSSQQLSQSSLSLKLYYKILTEINLYNFGKLFCYVILIFAAGPCEHTNKSSIISVLHVYP